jgi:hypothetical protein
MGRDKVTLDPKKTYTSGPRLLSTGLLNFVGGFQNPDQVDVRTYEEMLDTDETCASGVEFVKMAIKSRIGEYCHPDSRITSFIRRQFQRVRGSLEEIIDGMLSALWAGFSVGEMIFDAAGEFVLLSDVQFIHPGAVSFHLHGQGPAKNRVKGLSEGGGFAGEESQIPVEKLLIYTHAGRFGNPYGRSRFKPIYADYYVKKQMIVSWAKTLEKYGSPTAVGTVEDPAATVDDGSGTPMSQLEYMAGVLNSIQNTTSVAISGNSKIEFLQAKAALGSDFEAAVGYFNKMIFRGLLLPGLLEGGEKGGSYSLGQTHFDLFLLSVEQLRSEVIDTLLDQLVRRLITWNFGEQEDWGGFQVREFKPETAEAMSRIFLSMTNAGYLSPGRYEDAAHVRERIGVPGISIQEWQAQEESRAERNDAANVSGDEPPALQGPPAAKHERVAEEANHGSQELPAEGRFNGILNGILSAFTEI